MDAENTNGERSESELLFTRQIEAPRDLVWKAWTEPERLNHWWGPGGFRTTTASMEVAPGGTWLFVMHGPDGTEHAFNGTYREVDPPQRLVSTFEYEGAPGHVLVQTTELEEIEGQRTKLTLTSVYDNFEDRKGMVDAGTEGGLRESMDRLAEFVAAQPKGGS